MKDRLLRIWILPIAGVVMPIVLLHRDSGLANFGSGGGCNSHSRAISSITRVAAGLYSAWQSKAMAPQEDYAWPGV